MAIKRKTKKKITKRKSVSKKKKFIDEVDKLQSYLRRHGKKKTSNPGPLYQPKTVEEAIKYGYVIGARDGLNSCGILKIRQRRNLEDRINRIWNLWFGESKRQMIAMIEGKTRGLDKPSSKEKDIEKLLKEALGE